MSTFPVNLTAWEPQPNTISYIWVGRDIVPVRLERSEDGNTPLQWRSKKGNEIFPCSEYRYWAPRWSDLAN